MTAKLIALALVLSAAASTCLAAEAPSRYSMTTVEGSVWRLDGATGAMSVCGRKLDHWACESVTDDALALKEEVDRLSRENQELRDKLAKVEEKEAEAAPGKEPAPRSPYARFPDHAIDEMTDFVNAMIRRLQEMVQRLSGPQKREIGPYESRETSTFLLARSPTVRLNLQKECRPERGLVCGEATD